MKRAMSGAKKFPGRGYGDWFAYLFGYAEHLGGNDLKATAHEWIEVDRAAGTMTSKVNGMRYKCGQFRTPSLAALRADPAVQRFKGTGQLRLTVEFGDVSRFHADPTNALATFQAASQFNTLEFVGPDVVPERGVTCYSSDRTQGPACAIAAGPGTVYRNYFVREEDLEGGPWVESAQVGQSARQQVNNVGELLAALGDVDERGRPGLLVDVTGGYSMARGDDGLRRLNEGIAHHEAQGKRDELMGLLRLGVQADAQVTTWGWGNNPVGREQFEDKKPPYAAHPVSEAGERQLVTQVYGSACSVAYSRNHPALWEPFARLILEASYEATLLVALQTAARHNADTPAAAAATAAGDGAAAAAAGGAEAGGGPYGAPLRVYLTLLGGGVFGNEMSWIAAAIERACLKFRDTPLDVRIVSYSQNLASEVDALVGPTGTIAQQIEPEAYAALMAAAAESPATL